MCLTIDTKIHPDAKPLRTDKDIKCYKVVVRSYRTNFCPTGIFTPYQLAPITLKSLYGRDNIFKPHRFQQQPLTKLVRLWFTIPVIYNGIHVCMTKHSANAIMVEEQSLNPHGDYFIIPVKIPKGACYWVGTNDDLCAEYIQFPKNYKKYLK